MNIRGFEDLDIWKRSHGLTLRVYKITKGFPADERFGLTAQVRRSSASVCANIAEGYRKPTRDFIRYLDIAVGSLEETKYHLILSKDLEYCSRQHFDILYQEAVHISRMITAMIRKLRLNKR